MEPPAAHQIIRAKNANAGRAMARRCHAAPGRRMQATERHSIGTTDWSVELATPIAPLHGKSMGDAASPARFALRMK